MTEDLAERLDALETHVIGVSRENPGVLMRLDRLEWFVKLQVALVGMGLLWKIIDVFGSLIALRAGDP